ncbi:MAG: lipase maturation factor family protein [Planctomycetes bacterium]|nr:lipase maturation factor family protein [Planctomycetota bacterium]
MPTSPLERPLLTFDGDCNFCRTWIARWRRITGDRVDYVPYQVAASSFPEIPHAEFARAATLIEPDGRVTHAAEAVLRALAYAPSAHWMLDVYGLVPGAAPTAEFAYRLVARHRGLLSRITRLLWGAHEEPPGRALTAWVFLRFLGVVYFFAFASFGSQILGLVGRGGIWPAERYLEAWRDNRGSEAYAALPTLCWLNASDGFLQSLSWGGALLALLLVAGLAPVPLLALLWLFYLSLAKIGYVFMGYQWDALLLETGFLAIFLAPLRLFPRPSREPEPSATIVLLLRWLLFRLMFASGMVKLASHDATWRDGTALTYHYQTQPLPTWTSWYAHHLPLWCQQASVASTLAIELAVPFLLFAPRRVRIAAFFPLVGLQVLIAATGNYTFFNLLTVSLCLLLLDDLALPQWLRRRVLGPAPAPAREVRGRWSPWVIAPLASALLLLSGHRLLAQFDAAPELSTWTRTREAIQRIEAFEIVSQYGLFARMTTTRDEIVVEGSRDGKEWKAYEFPYKPGDLRRAPVFIAPLQPRLDWQMWFASLGRYQQNPWFLRFCRRLLEGSPEVLALLETNPFPDSPPRFLRASFYRYRFTTPEERARTGAWWAREALEPYLPEISLR